MEDAGSCLNTLSKLGEDEREKFVHRVINDICEKTGLKYEDYFKLLTLAEYSKLKHTLSHSVRLLSKDQLKKEELADRLKAMGVNQDISEAVATCVWVRREEIQSQLVKESCNISESRLDDFDWKLKLIMSSDQLSAIQQPVVALDLNITEDGQKRSETIEMSRDELSHFVESLEAANKVVTQLRT